MFSTKFFIIVLVLTYSSVYLNNGQVLSNLSKSPLYKAFQCTSNSTCASMGLIGRSCENVTATFRNETVTGRVCACPNGYLNQNCDASLKIDFCGGGIVCALQRKTCNTATLLVKNASTTFSFCA
jgi:hypothetical protein